MESDDLAMPQRGRRILSRRQPEGEICAYEWTNKGAWHSSQSIILKCMA